MKNKFWVHCLVVMAGVCSPALIAQDADEMNEKKEPEISSLGAELESLKEQVLEINRDLFILEEDLLFPASTQISVFVSMDIGMLFQLDSIMLKINNKEITSYLYTEREVDALRRGAVQRLYLGNLPSGEHEIVAVFTGKGPDDRDYKRATTLTFEKGTDKKMIELQITDDEAKLQPRFAAKEWQ